MNYDDNFERGKSVLRNNPNDAYNYEEPKGKSVLRESNISQEYSYGAPHGKSVLRNNFNYPSEKETNSKKR